MEIFYVVCISTKFYKIYFFERYLIYSLQILIKLGCLNKILLKEPRVTLFSKPSQVKPSKYLLLF